MYYYPLLLFLIIYIIIHLYRRKFYDGHIILVYLSTEFRIFILRVDVKFIKKHVSLKTYFCSYYFKKHIVCAVFTMCFSVTKENFDTDALSHVHLL